MKLWLDRHFASSNYVSSSSLRGSGLKRKIKHLSALIRLVSSSSLRGSGLKPAPVRVTVRAVLFLPLL
ncbi:hypothetical protein LEP1GSC166_3208 [Leptospira kirschneri]|nr:hypothetical protein LEP1GSC166_3208 [Leptospira kirschneri]